METPMLAIVRTVRRRLRQQFLRINGKYRMTFTIYARAVAEFNRGPVNAADLPANERQGPGR